MTWFFFCPKIVGASVSTLILSVSKTLSDQQVNVILAQVPNVRTVNLSYTHITSEAFDGLYKHNALRKLEDLQLQGWFHEFILKNWICRVHDFFYNLKVVPVSVTTSLAIWVAVFLPKRNVRPRGRNFVNYL